MSKVLEAIWTFLNSGVGITLVAGGLVWIFHKIYSKRPTWQEFEGSIIAAVRYGERAIPDNTPNKSKRRLDEALKFVIKVYTKAKSRPPTTEEVRSLVEGIEIIHEEMEHNV